MRTFSYDLENHLKSASAPTSVTLTYDPLGRLQTSRANSVTTTFLYDGNNLVGEYDASGNILARYVFGPGVDDPLVWYQGAGTTNRNWLHMDNQNSAVAWSNSSGALVGSRGYGPYGEPSIWTGPRFAYTGQIMIPEAQLYHYKARVYDPGIGRFLQTDPVGYGSDVNSYAYASNSPIRASDSTGLEAGTTYGSPTCPIEMCTAFVLSRYNFSYLDYSTYNGITMAILVGGSVNPQDLTPTSLATLIDLNSGVGSGASGISIVPGVPLNEIPQPCDASLIGIGNALRRGSAKTSAIGTGFEAAGAGIMLAAAPAAPPTAGADEIPGATVVAVGGFMNMGASFEDLAGTAFQWGGGAGPGNFVGSVANLGVSLAVGRFISSRQWIPAAKAAAGTAADTAMLAASGTNGRCGAE